MSRISLLSHVYQIASVHLLASYLAVMYSSAHRLKTVFVISGICAFVTGLAKEHWKIHILENLSSTEGLCVWL